MLPLNRRLVVLVASSAVVQGSLLIPVPLVIRDIFDNSIPQRDLTRLVSSGVLLILLVTVSGGFAVILRHATLKLVQSHLAELRRTLAGLLVGAPLSALQQTPDEDIRDRLIQDTLRYSSAVSAIAGEVLPTVLTAGAVATVLLFIDPVMLLLAAVLMLPLVAFNRLLGGRVQRDVTHYHDRFRMFSAGTIRMLQRAPITRVHGAQKLEIADQERLVDELADSSIDLDCSRSLYLWALQSVIVGSALTMLVVGGIGVINGSRTLGDLFAFYAAIALIRPALDTAVRVAPTLTEGRLARRRLDELAGLNTTDLPQGSARLDFRGQVSVRQLSFDYGDRRILDGVDLDLEPGTVTLLRGPNGSGKTTLVRLLCGLLPPTSGTIIADGRSYDDLDLDSLRRSIGVVFQEALIAGSTIEEALAYGDHTLDPAAIADAIEATGLAPILDRLPDGLQTRIGPGGVTLSGGERQRLAIAQALVRRPRLLLLDEPTNHLDAQAVAAVVDELVGRPGGPAVLVVTHEDSRRFRPDQIIELSNERPSIRHQPVRNLPMSTTTFSRVTGTAEMTVEDHTVVVDRRGEQMVTLNSVGGFIWEELDRPASVTSLVGACAKVFSDVGHDQLTEDVDAFVRSAVEIGIIEAATD